MERNRFPQCWCTPAIVVLLGSATATVTAQQAATQATWALQPITEPELPAVADAFWPIAPIDRFILARLEAAGLSPSPPAEQRTLIRRATYDLTALPPTPEEVDAFLADRSPDAFATVVERLLASPRYGERWGRHWLDVARFADTKDGVLMYGADRIRPYAYTYRDYVIRAVNEDLPFDRFIHEQLAADQLQPPVEPWRLAAMGFLTLGRMFDSNVHDVIDDRIDTVTRGLLGLTVTCARCHDHKYDAVTMEDYYSLYGVFASSQAPIELPLIGQAADRPGAKEFEEKAGAKRREIQEFLDSQYALLSQTARDRVSDYLVHVATTEPDPLETAIYFLSLAPEDLRPPIVARWRRLIEQRATADDPVFGPWHDLMEHPNAELAAGVVPRVLNAWSNREPGTGPGQVNPLVLAALGDAAIQTRADVARAYGQLLSRIANSEQPAAGAGDDAACGQLRALVAGPHSPAYFSKSQTWRYMSRKEKDAFGGKLRELDRMAAQSADAPPRAMVLVDAPQLYDPRVFLRGNPSRPGKAVPRQFLAVLRGNTPRPFSNGSGRLDLAKAITAPDNPLTSRVIVNRVWMHHFGEPLVQTPSDFGTRSQPPSHPKLLDYLAWRFRDGGWSLKQLHRAIMLSRTYQQAGFDRPQCRRVDPENRLLWRMNRRRLELESMRDSLLAVSGRLQHVAGGRPVNVAGDAQNRLRTVYGLVDRQSLPGLYRAFDFASPDQSVSRRPFTTTPQQALFGMNSPFVIVQAKALAARPEVASENDAPARVRMMYRLVFTRKPEPAEVAAANEFLSAAAAEANAESGLTPLEQFAQVLLLTNELMFID